jgi:hypothetical protein
MTTVPGRAFSSIRRPGALDLLAKDHMQDFQELADEAFCYASTADPSTCKG